MPVLLHITKAEAESSVLRSGIKAGKHNNCVYFMPHTEKFLISHQWARELKRSGVKNFLAVDFKLPADEIIWFGKYFDGHEQLPLNEAIEKLLFAEDKFGYEFFIERKIAAKEILKTRRIRKPMGWRYSPSAHGKSPCPCPMCVQSGGFKTSNIKEKKLVTFSRAEAKKILVESDDEDLLIEALERMKGKWRKESPEYLRRLLSSKEEYVLYYLVELLADYRHPLTIEFLNILAKNDDVDSSEIASSILKEITKSDKNP